MTDDETVALGNFCENLMTNPMFNTLVEQFEKQIVNHFMQTEPHEAKRREGIYASYSGVRDFLANMKAIVIQRDGLIAPKNELSEFDAPIIEDND